MPNVKEIMDYLETQLQAKLLDQGMGYGGRGKQLFSMPEILTIFREAKLEVAQWLVNSVGEKP